MTNSTAEPFLDESPGEVPVRGYLHRAVPELKDVLILTHGTSGNYNTPLLVALAEAFAASGVNVLRCDLPFRQAHPKGPPSPANAKHDQEGLRRGVVLMRSQFSGRVFLGGQSYGGRQASMLAASDPELVDALLLLSYPLHPPGRPAQMRTAHFPNLRTPCLFVHGTTDPFATSDELEQALKLIPARTRVIEVAGAGHSLLTKANRDALPETVVEALVQFTQQPT